MDQNKLLSKIMPGVEKMQSNIYVSSITNGMMGTMGVMMASAIFQLIYSFPIEPWTNFLQSIGLYSLLTTVVNICNLTAIFMVFNIGRTLGEKKGVDGIQTGLASLLCFLIITPLEEVAGDFGSTIYINTSWLGAQGIFTAMIVAMLAPTLYAFCIKRNIVIKLPDAVPEFVSKNLSGIPSALATVVPFVAIRGIFETTAWGSFTSFIYSMIQTPLSGLGNSLPAHLIAVFICCFLWWCGVHGTLVVLGAAMAVWSAATIQNLTAFNAGQPIPFLLSSVTFFLILQFTGGPGCLFGLYINMAFFSKSERFKAQGKLSLVPGLFNIIEPTVYGVPVVLNPVLLVPFVGLPVVCYILYYVLASIGIIGVPAVNLTVMVLPGPIAGFLLGGGISLGIFMLAILALSVVVYYPFFKVLDNQALKEEQALAAQQKAE